MCVLLSNSYLAENARLDLIADYLIHEAKKGGKPIYKDDPPDCVSSRTSDGHARLLVKLRSSCSPQTANVDIDAFLAQLSLPEKWKLFHAVSCGGVEKDLFNCVGNPEYFWTREQIPLRQTRFESKVGPLACMAEERPVFSEAIRFLRDRGGQDGNVHRVGDPLIGRKRDEEVYVLIHDGNGRLLSRAFEVLRGERTEDECISMWVGHPRKASIAEQALYQEARTTIFCRTT